MAKLYDRITTPEAGWKRTDQTDSCIQYIGNWVEYKISGYYNGSMKYTLNADDRALFFLRVVN